MKKDLPRRATLLSAGTEVPVSLINMGPINATGLDLAARSPTFFDASRPLPNDRRRLNMMRSIFKGHP
jgi:hypothetical protein